jgi:DNA-binding response OmpR family regulator
MKILLVEDDSDDRQIFGELIKKMEFPVDLAHARDCVELFEYLENNPDVHLIFQDINLPLKNGKQCLKDLKSHERYKHIPVIIYTVSGSEQDIHESYENGAHYYVIKPYANVNFMETMKKVFSVDWTSSQPPLPEKENFVINMTYT